MDKPETLKGALETWRYAGRRLAKGKTYHEWHFLGDPPESGWWPVKGSTTYIVGAQYEIRADRGQDGEATTMYGRPQFLRADHSAPAADWEMRDRATQNEVEKTRLAANAKRAGVIDEALAPLLELAGNGSIRSYAAQQALVEYVSARLWKAMR